MQQQWLLLKDNVYSYHTRIKFYGLIFRVFDWQLNAWDINFCGHGSMIDTIVVTFAKNASYCGLIVVDKRHTMKFTKFIYLKNFSVYGIDNGY